MIASAAVAKTLQNKFCVTHTLFDFYEVEKLSQRYKNQVDDSSSETVLKILEEKVQTLTPTCDELLCIKTFHLKIKQLISNYMSANKLFGAQRIVEVADIGSLKMSNMLKGHMTSDIMCVFSGPVSCEDHQLLAEQVRNDLTLENSEEFHWQISSEHAHVNVVMAAQSDCRVMLWPATRCFDGYKEGFHISYSLLRNNIIAIKHASWFGEYAISEPAIIQMIILLKDIKRKYDGFKSLNPWLLSLLAHYSVTNNYDRKTLTLDAAFRRCFKLLSAGLLLPHSVGIVDHCDDKVGRSHMYMSLQQQDYLCATAQTLLRLYNAFGIEKVLNLSEWEIQNKLVAGDLEFNVHQ